MRLSAGIILSFCLGAARAADMHVTTIYAGLVTNSAVATYNYSNLTTLKLAWRQGTNALPVFGALQPVNMLIGEGYGSGYGTNLGTVTIASNGTAFASISSGSSVTLVASNNTPQSLPSFTWGTTNGDGVLMQLSVTNGASVWTNANYTDMWGGCYKTPVSGTQLGYNGSNNFRHLFNYGNQYRVRRSGTARACRLYSHANPEATNGWASVNLTFWRPNGTKFDWIATSENICAMFTNSGACNWTFTTPVAGLQEGDFIGFYVDCTGRTNSNYQLEALTSQTSVDTYSEIGSVPSSTAYDWLAQTKSANVGMPIQVTVDSPDAVFIGDSLVAGHSNGGNYSLVEASQTWIPNYSMAYWLEAWGGWRIENVGIGGQTTANFTNRFVSDVLSCKPRMAIINGGINDIAGSWSLSAFTNNWNWMLSQCLASNVFPVILQMWPNNNLSATQNTNKDTAITNLITIASNAMGTNGCILLDLRAVLGIDDTNYYSGNCWLLNTNYNDDGVHLKQLGYKVAATNIFNAITNWCWSNKVIF